MFYVYILASAKNGTLYTGVTSDLLTRIHQHRSDLIEGFTKKYKVHALVYYEETSNAISAITREKNIKEWRRQWKINLIEKDNPGWVDLYPSLIN